MVLLPHVIVTVNSDGTLTVTIDGESFAPEPYAPPWRRTTFGTLIDRISDHRRTPVRVEVRETDGSVFTDIITPAKQHPTQFDPVPQAPKPAAPPELVEVTADGFVPGEDVAVAIIITHTDAAHTGIARALLEATQLNASPTGEVVLLGRVSGTYEIVSRR
ncbi:hypothetical protein [Leucobacter komagatae]|nr:hypothetical protein [Leucobacter komagatae]